MDGSPPSAANDGGKTSWPGLRGALEDIMHELRGGILLPSFPSHPSSKKQETWHEPAWIEGI